MIRSHEAGSLRATHAGERVTLAGWVARRRDHGGVAFVDLRDASGVVQVVIRDEQVARPLRAEFCVRVDGQVAARPEGNANDALPTGAVEVVAFGQVRPGEGAQRVEIERLDPTAGWVGEPSLPVVGVRPDESCGEFQSDPQGYYGRRLAARELGTYRGVWRRSDGGTEASPEVTVGLPRPVLGGARGALQPGP